MLKLFLKALARILRKAALFLPSQCFLFYFTLEGVSLQAPWWEYCGLKLHMEHFRSCSAGFCPPIGPLFSKLGNRLLSLWVHGWVLVYTSLSTMDGFTGHIRHWICTEQYMLSKADHPEAQLVSISWCRHQFLFSAGTNIFVLVLWNQPGSWSISKLTQLERGKKVNLNLDMPWFVSLHSCLCCYSGKGWWERERTATVEVRVGLLFSEAMLA